LYAQPFLNEVQVSQEVSIVDQPPYVEPAMLASKHITPWLITFQECFVVSKFLFYQMRIFADHFSKFLLNQTRGCERKVYVWSFHLNWNPQNDNFKALIIYPW
jgi:hypothetical protein